MLASICLRSDAGYHIEQHCKLEEICDWNLIKAQFQLSQTAADPKFLYRGPKRSRKHIAKGDYD